MHNTKYTHDLIKKMNIQFGLPITEVTKAVRFIFNQIARNAAANIATRIVRFGVFTLHKRKARDIVHVRHQQKVTVPQRYVLFCRFSDGFIPENTSLPKQST